MELKNGETFNGTMSQCDTWMNVHLKEVICTSKDGDRFWKMKEAFIRGNTIKYIRVPDDILGKVTEEKFDKAGPLLSVLALSQLQQYTSHVHVCWHSTLLAIQNEY